MRVPREGEVWQHINAKKYTILCLAKDQDREEVLVIHRGEDGQIWSRIIGNFMAYKGDVPRFTLVQHFHKGGLV